jgi:hypothetical protein
MRTITELGAEFGRIGLVPRVEIVTAQWADGSLRADTIQDFLEKSGSAGRLSTTFHTDVPRTFIKPDSVWSKLGLNL